MVNVGSNASLLTNFSTTSLMQNQQNVSLNPSIASTVSMDTQSLRPTPPTPTPSLVDTTAAAVAASQHQLQQQAFQGPPPTFASTFATVPPSQPPQTQIAPTPTQAAQVPPSLAAFQTPLPLPQQPPTQPAVANSSPFNMPPTTAHLFNPVAVGGAGVAAFNPATGTASYFNPAQFANLPPPTALFQQLNLSDKVL